MHVRAIWRHAALVAAIAGAGISAYLLVEYLKDSGGICVTGSRLRRGSARPRMHYPLGVPLPLYGLVFYLVAGWLAWRTLNVAPLLGVSPRSSLVGLALSGPGRFGGAHRARGVRHPCVLHLVPGAGRGQPGTRGRGAHRPARRDR